MRPCCTDPARPECNRSAPRCVVRVVRSAVVFLHVLALVACQPSRSARPLSAPSTSRSAPRAGSGDRRPIAPSKTTEAARDLELGVASNTACIRRGPQVYCWGANYFDPESDEQCRRRLNDTDYPCHRQPTRVLVRHTAAGEPAGFRKIAAGSETVCGVLESSLVVCWGYGLHGGLGDGTSEMSDRPRLVVDLEGVVDIAVGSAHACSLGHDGIVDCWGRNLDGELGDGGRSDRAIPSRVRGLPPVTQIFAGGMTSCAVTAKGVLWCWGDNGHGQVVADAPSDHLVPVRVPSVPTVAQIDLDAQEVCARTLDAGVWCWGGGPAVSAKLNANLQPPARLAALDGAKQLAVGHAHACAVMPGGSAECWGHNSSGNLGDGTITNRFAPAPIEGVEDVVEVDATWRLDCARTRGGEVYCWGDGDVGQIGDGQLQDRDLPTRVHLPW